VLVKVMNHSNDKSNNAFPSKLKNSPTYFSNAYSLILIHPDVRFVGGCILFPYCAAIFQLFVKHEKKCCKMYT
jgi:hypothetical protein